MRDTASILHVDLDAFFAAVEQRDKPSLRGKPVIVGGIGSRGVVSTASYEVRPFGVRSAMSMAEARGRCPHAAFLGGRFDAYREASKIVMNRLRELSPLVQPLSLDEAFVDLAASAEFDPSDVDGLVARLRADVAELTGGLTCSAGVASSKFLAKVASELNKPDGQFVVRPGSELALLGPMQVTAIPGVGPATAERLRRIGAETIEQLRSLSRDELIGTLGKANGQSLFRLARAEDDRPVEAHREAKSISVEDTFATDIADRAELESVADALARTVARRLRAAGQSARTVTLKLRRHDFETHTRSTTLAGPTDHPRLITDTALELLRAADVSGGLRLLGVGVSGLTDWVQDDLFTEEPSTDDPAPVDQPGPRRRGGADWAPGMDVRHAENGDGWVWGSGLGRVTVRFETRRRPDGPVLTFDADDPALSPRPSADPGTVDA